MKSRKEVAADALKAAELEQGAVITKARKERDAALKTARMRLQHAEERMDSIKAHAETEREDTVGGAKKESEMAIREKAATLAKTKAEQQIEQLEEKATEAEEAIRRYRSMVKGESYTEPSDEEGDQLVPRSLFR